MQIHKANPRPTESDSQGGDEATILEKMSLFQVILMNTKVWELLLYPTQ
jgi:hypothetical protein